MTSAGLRSVRRRWWRLSFWLLVAVLGFPAVGGAELAARAAVDRTQLSLHDVLQLNVVVSGGDGVVDTTPIRDFQVASRGQASSVQIVNTRVTRETRFHYALTPLRVGDLVVPALTVRSDGEEVVTDPISIRVTEAAAAADEVAEVALRPAVSNSTPFQGEEFAYVLRVEAAVPLYDASYREPEFAGFLVRKLDGQRTSTAVRGGREVRVTEITYLLTPRQSGSLTIGPATLNCQVPAPEPPGRRRGPFDPFGDSFFRRQRVVEKVIRSPAVSLEVRALPPAPMQPPFSGLVGDFSLSAALTPSSLAAGDSATLTLVLEGRGNVEEAPAPEVAPPPGFKLYPDHPETEVESTPAGTAGTKRFGFALVPTAAGDYRVGPFRLSVFDPATGAYETLQAGPLPLQVTPGAAPSEVGATASSQDSILPMLSPKRRVEQRGEDILDIHRGLSAIESRPVLGVPTLLGLFAVPPLCYLLARLATAARRRERTLGERMRERAGRDLGEAAAAWRRDDPVAALGHLQRGVTAAALARGQRAGEVLTYGEAAGLLAAAGVSADLCRETVEVLESLDAARYGGEIPEDRIRAIMQRCERVVAALGRQGREA